MPEQNEGGLRGAAAAKAPERFARRIDCAPAAGRDAEPSHRSGGRGTGRLREPGAGLPDSES